MKHPLPDTPASAPAAAHDAQVRPADGPPAAQAAPPRPGIGAYYVVEGISSHSVSLMLSAIYFFTTGRFGWGSAENYTLAAVLGVVYVAGALSAHAVAARLGRRQTLVTVYLLMSAAAGVAVAGHGSPWVLVPVLIAYSALSAVTWPPLESLVSSGAGAGELSRRLGVYNCVWSGSGAVTVAGAGLLLKYWPAGTFVIPAFWHAAMALLLLRRLLSDPARRRGTARDSAPGAAAPGAPPAHASPEPELLRVRTLAL